MGSEYMGPLPDPSAQQGPPSSGQKPFAVPGKNEHFAPFNEDDTQPRRAISVPPSTNNRQAAEPTIENTPYQEPSYSEHVTGSLPVVRSEAPNFRRASQPYPVRLAPVATPQAAQPGQGQAVHPGPAQPAQPPQTPMQQPYPYYPYYPYYQGQYGQQPGYWGQPAAQPNGYYPYAAYPYYGGYYGYPSYPYPYYGYGQPPKPKRSAYQLTMGIISLVGGSIAVLAGLFDVLVVLLLTVLPMRGGAAAAKAEFSGIAEFVAFAAAGLLGGGFSIYHGLRAILKKPSAEFKLPWFWLFLLIYGVVIAIAGTLQYAGLAVANLPVAFLLIALAGVLPATTIVALGLRRIHFPRAAKWPTTWRRFAMALISGATMAIVLALIFELILMVIAVQAFNIHNISLDDPNQPLPSNLRGILFIFVIVSVIAPVVEESVKPLAVVTMIGRISSAAEAFVLGLGCGIGFDLVETTGYIGSGYKDWLNVALERSSAGLLHGFGAGMTALGWYLITHPGSAGKYNRVLLGLGCMLYAMLQHALWNGSFGLQLLPAPIGPYLDKGTIAIGSFKMESFIMVYVVETILMLIFFFFVTKKLRSRQDTKPSVHESEKNVSSTADSLQHSSLDRGFALKYNGNNT